MFDMNKAEEKDYSEIKLWFFKENVRISKAKQELEEERRAFESEKKKALRELKKKRAEEELASERLKRDLDLFDKKVEVLNRELRQLASDRQKLEREKAIFQENRLQKQTQVLTPKLFFKGVDNELALKKRYRDLTKIFHPDNLNGDTDTLKHINKEYNALKQIYSS